MVRTSNWSTAFVANAHLHCTSALSYGVNVAVGAFEPVSLSHSHSCNDLNPLRFADSDARVKFLSQITQCRFDARFLFFLQDADIFRQLLVQENLFWG